MLCSHIRIILLLVPITQLSGVVNAKVVKEAKETCADRICNNEAKCEIKDDGGPYCACIGITYFTGKFCMEQVDNCLPNPCRNGDPCTNALGQPICGPCVAGFGGHLCDVPKAGTFTKMYLHHNRYGYLAVDEQFLFTLESLGSAAFLLEFHADNYAIEAFKTDPRKPVRWHKSSDLAGVAREFGLHHADMLPYQSGFYHVTTGRFWMIGFQKLRLKVTDIDSLQSYVENTYNMQILPKDAHCRPEIQLVHCADPFKPLMMDVGRYTTLQAIVRKRCWKSSQMKFEWKVYNSIETVLLHSYGQTSVPRLKVSPYPPWTSHLGELMQSFLIRIGIKETFGDEQAYIVARCYVFILSKPVVAQIVGGSEREVDAKASIRLDGSPSRDFATSPTIKRYLKYSWTCESSDDPKNKYCAKRMSSDKVLIIPMGTLRHGMTYKFTLEVRSKVNVFSRNEATQTITLVTTQPLDVDIECVRNCAAWRFVPQQMLHLKALCLNCEYQTIKKYIWTINGEQVAFTKRLIISKANDEARLVVQVQLDHDSRQGKATVTLSRNSAPTGGECKASPISGEELTTKFHLSCNNFQDDDQPLSYEFVAETITLDRTSDPSTEVWLSKGSGVTITICDSMRACVTASVDVKVKEIDGNSGLIPFLDSYESSLIELLRNGDIQHAMILAIAATRLIDSMDDVKYLTMQMQQLTLQTLLDAEQFLHVISGVFKKRTPTQSEEVDTFRKLLAKLASGFEVVLDDGEVREMSLQSYTRIQSELTSYLESLTNPTETINNIQTVEPARVHSYNRIDESYPAIDISDTEILPRLNIWVQYGATITRCMKLVGWMAAYVHEPDEPDTITTQSELRIDSFSFDNRTSLTLNTPDGVARIVVESAVVYDIQALLHSPNVLLQVVSTPKDPFWWFPDEQNINTGVLYFSGFSSSLKPNFNGMQLVDLLELTLKVNITPDAKGDSTTHMLGCLVSNTDMNIFQIGVPKNTLLAVSFVSTTIDLQVLMTLDSKPSGYRTHRSNIFIKKAGDSRPLLLVNKENDNLNAYLGVVPAEAINGSPALFAFVPELRECLSWSFDLADPRWTTDDCWPKTADSVSESGLQCYCKHMSTYAGKVFPTTGFSLYGVGNLIETLPINWFMICAQAMVGLIFISWVLIAYFCLQPNRDHLVITPKVRSTYISNMSNGEIIVRFTTGGYRNASTTAGVILIINTTNGPMKFKIYQNPKYPHLKQHSTCSVRLPLNPELLTHPVTVFLRHDGGGRYPTWYCRQLEIDYPKIEKPITLSVDCWVDEIGFQLSEGGEPKIRKHRKWKHFAVNLDTICTNWFFYNPLFGPWKYGNMTCNRFERTLIWMLKFAFTVLIISFSYGWTTPYNYERERSIYEYVSSDLLHIFLLSLLSFFVGSVLQFGIEYWIFKSTQESFDSAV